jgi:hypothetical protein
MDVVYKFHTIEEEQSIYFTSKYYIHQVPTPLRLTQRSHFFHFIEER